MTDGDPHAPDDDFRSGHAAFIGRPNAGKSTLLNRILGTKLAIVSDKPQTTRDRIVGIHTDETMQVVLLDTPGVHKAWTELNKAMVQRAEESLAEVDVVVWVEDATVLVRRIDEGEPALDAASHAVCGMIESAGTPVVVALNKVDLVAPASLLPVLEAISERLPDLRAAVPISALRGGGVDDLLAAMREALPAGPALYPPEVWTEATERFLAAEIIREKVFHLTQQEIPYASTVEIESFDEARRDEGRIAIRAVIIVEKPSQKGIVIGKGGEMVKRIGTLARKELNALLDARVHLELFVKVEKDWTKTARGLRKVGFDGRGR